MKREHQAFLGMVVIVFLLLGYALFSDALRKYGPWLWIPVGVIVAGNVAAAVRFPQYRTLLSKVITVGFTAVAEVFSRDGSGRGEKWPERQTIPPARRQWVLQRAGGRCQYKGCSRERGLNVHHIDMDRSDPKNENNLIAVCPNHHSDLHNGSLGITSRQARAWAQGRYLSRRRART